MRETKFPSNCSLPGDSEAMSDAISALCKLGIPFTRTTRHQLKLGDWNFYPKRGTIVRDGTEGAESDRGLDALLARLRREQGAPEKSRSNYPDMRKPLVVLVKSDHSSGAK